MGTTRLLTPKYVKPFVTRDKHTDGLGEWPQRMLGMTDRRIVIVALADCLLRIAWARLTSGQRFGVRLPPTPAV